jgi:hypothetical protein
MISAAIGFRNGIALVLVRERFVDRTACFESREIRARAVEQKAPQANNESEATRNHRN